MLDVSLNEIYSLHNVIELIILIIVSNKKAPIPTPTPICITTSIDESRKVIIDIIIVIM